MVVLVFLAFQNEMFVHFEAPEARPESLDSVSQGVRQSLFGELEEDVSSRFYPVNHDSERLRAGSFECT